MNKKSIWSAFNTCLLVVRAVLTISALAMMVVLVSCESFESAVTIVSDSFRSTATESRLTIDQLLEAGPSQVEHSFAESQLYSLIMDYRTEKGLPIIPMSKSLSFVAKLHVRDLSENTFPDEANYHSWSANGPWQAVNYTEDHRYASLMWNKPRELTRYPGNGYEIAYRNSSGASAQSALSGWKSSPRHNEVIVNEGQWRAIEWSAIGIGIYGQYAVVWFGEEVDPEQ